MFIVRATGADSICLYAHFFKLETISVIYAKIASVSLNLSKLELFNIYFCRKYVDLFLPLALYNLVAVTAIAPNMTDPLMEKGAS